MKFTIEQVAINPPNPEIAQAFLAELGAAEWCKDQVRASGNVYGAPTQSVANLAFNYSIMPGGEFEVLSYLAGENWLEGGCRSGGVSHLGMHCSAEELIKWREFFAAKGVPVAQEVVTTSHTNPAIKDDRRYNYVIFDTKAIIGVDLKFIVRLPYA